MNKPLCKKCGAKHWRFVACDDAPAINEIEAVNAVKREASKVYPQFRRPDGTVAPKTANWSTDYKRGK